MLPPVLVGPGIPLDPPVEGLVLPPVDCSIEINSDWPPQWVSRGLKSKVMAQLDRGVQGPKLFPLSMNEVYGFVPFRAIRSSWTCNFSMNTELLMLQVN